MSDLFNVVRPALLLRKPLEKGLTIAQNVLKHGTGALNIDGCRFGYGDPCWVGGEYSYRKNYLDKDGNQEKGSGKSMFLGDSYAIKRSHKHPEGRWPANLYQCSGEDTPSNTINNKTRIDMTDQDMWHDMPTAKIMHGNCMDLLKELPDCSIDAIVTDPPYGMSPDGIARTWADIEEGRKMKGFMGKEWDAAVPCHNFFAECFRVLKHGGHMIAFSSTRTVCALGMAAQKGGFRIRDMIHWCYFSGFPKSHDISKAIDREAGAVREVAHLKGKSGKDRMCMQGDFAGEYFETKPATQDAQKWAGFGTALKPAVEPALLLRKPLEKGLTIAQNVLKHGTGALNIDGCRFGYGDPCWVGSQEIVSNHGRSGKSVGTSWNLGKAEPMQTDGQKIGRWPANLYQCAKASRSEREEGLEHLESRSGADTVHRKEGSAGLENPRAGAGRTANEVRNIHPTVKPIKLMRWCCRLIGGQKGSVILDPFCGSGTTGAAAILEGFDFVGMEITPEYLPIINGRLQWAREEYKRENAQLSLFGGM
ncbi:MAG: putative modification methylase [Prokaryotic dsDNA virus sp.]|nr:MAG: putative modification methylase [Prokaryotic dsDNA virus sp.]|tara:strand:- start:1172 stop:2773 length:1602 start_codon:yes stop_codon:yes gene_type:complete